MMGLFSSAEVRRKVLLQLFVLSVVLGGLYFVLYQYVSGFTDPRGWEAMIRQFGIFAPLVFILFQLLQVILAPIPGQLMTILSGYLFGTVLGTIYSLIGVTIGSYLAFRFAKRFGRSYIEQTFHTDIIDYLDEVVEKAGVPGLFLIFLIPGPPDDILCFLAGTTNISNVTFLLIVIGGRAPGYVLVNFAGESFARTKLTVTVSILFALAVFSAIAYFKQSEILSAVS